MSLRILILGGFALFLTACAMSDKPEETSLAAPAAAAAAPLDPQAHLWLEEVEGAAALDWVRARNTRSLAALEGDPRFPKLRDDALAIVRAKDRLTFGGYLEGYVSNFWQDDVQVRGVWRRAPFDGWRAGAPQWETVLDIDALAAAEGANWVYKGSTCLDPHSWATRCLVNLSDGGKDAVTVREFDLGARRFVEGGFTLPEAKLDVTWVDADTLLVATDWGAGAVTESGYPFIVKELKRGQPLSAAVEVFRGTAKDVAASAFRLDDGRGFEIFFSRAPTFFTSETHWRGPDGRIVKLALPSKHSVVGLVDGALIFSTQEPWVPAGASAPLPEGALYSAPLAALATGRAVMVTTIYRPGPREALAGAAVAKDGVYAVVTRNVVSEVRKYVRSGETGLYQFQRVELPDQGVASVADISPRDVRAFFSFNNFLTPPSIFMSAAGETPTVAQSEPARFNPAGLTIEQHEATSKDGTKVPYFVVRRTDAPMDGSTPTLLYGYGGFEVSMLPNYAGTTGKLWLERGGAYVLANIRGGGEFGPAWHQAGLKTKRQVIYDDFAAVAEDVIARKLTSPRRLGMMGGSNGGLLMGVMLNQRPDLFNAAVVQVPLLDMLRYDKLLAGASWVDEYGDPDTPEERAWLERLSPYHNLTRRPDFPVPFIVTSTKDDRVHPAHARKYAARLEELGMDYLYYENIDGGHSAAANLVEAARRRALEFTYLSQRLMD